MRTILRLLGFLRPFSGWVALSVLLGVATIASNIGLLGTSAYLIARAALHPSIAELEVAIVGVRFFGIGRGVFRYLERLVSHSVNFHLLGQLRVWFYQKLEPLAPARLMDIHSGDLLSRSVADIETLQDFYVRAAAPPITAAIVTLGMALFVGQADPGLGFILTGGLLLSGLGVPYLSAILSRKTGRELVSRRADLSQLVVDGIQGLPDLLVFDQAEAAHLRFSEQNEALRQIQTRLALTGAAIGGLNLMLVNLTLVGVLLFAIPLTNQNRLDGVTLAILALITLASFEAVSPLGTAAQQLQSSQRAAQRLFEVVDQAPVVTDPTSPLTPPENLDLVVENLSFSYPGVAQPAIQDLSFVLPPGKRLGIVGPSGAGKSSLINLLLRFWEYEQGHILLNGQEIRRYQPADLRQRMAVISQETTLFTGTLRENLLLGSSAASDEELAAVLKQVQLGDWLGNPPAGLDTWLGDRGLLMSGGERQRLAAARALLHRADLFLFDEPTSHLDSQTEADLVGLLLKLTRGKSVLWISHSLQGMEAMDEVLVLKDGQIVERGSPAVLLAQRGWYSRLAGTFPVKPSS